MASEGFSNTFQGGQRGNEKDNSNRASWNELHRAFLVELLVHFNKPGTRQQNGWSSVAWNDITKRFQEKFPDANFNTKQIKEQEHTLKKQYKTILKLRDQSGFGWDDYRSMVTAPPEVWAPLLCDKEVKRWYNKSFPYYDDLHKIYASSIAMGARRKGSNQVQANIDVETAFESPNATIPAPGLHNDMDNDYFSTQVEEPPLFTEPQDLPSMHAPPSAEPPATTDSTMNPAKRTVKKRHIEKFQDEYLTCKKEETSLICATIKEASQMKAVALKETSLMTAQMGAEREDKFSIEAAMKAFEQLEGFNILDYYVASTMFMENPKMREGFLSCSETKRAELMKLHIDAYKAKHKELNIPLDV